MRSFLGFWIRFQQLWGIFWDFGIVAGAGFGILGLPPEPGSENSREKSEREPQARNFSRILWDEAQSQTGNNWEGWEKGKRDFLGGILGDSSPQNLGSLKLKNLETPQKSGSTK